MLALAAFHKLQVEVDVMFVFILFSSKNDLEVEPYSRFFRDDLYYNES